MIKLTSIYDVEKAYGILYDLLSERTPEQSISHKGMPTWEQHCAFVGSKPYKAWYFIENDENWIVGSTYLTNNNEIGIFIFNKFHRNGYAMQALKLLMDKHDGPFLANVNPQNIPSRNLFEKLGGRMIQVTYELA